MNAAEWIERNQIKGLSYALFDNRLGLQYFAGMPRSDAWEAPDFGPEGPGRTREELLEEYGSRCGHVRILYPYPSADYIEAVFSDEWIPAGSDLKQNCPSTSGARLQLFDEPAAWQTIVREGLFGEFAPSFILEYGDREVFPRLVYQKQPTNRGPAYALETSIYQEADGSRFVTKRAQSPAAGEHLGGIFQAYEKLLEEYKGSPLCINGCRLVESDGECLIRLDYEKGETLTALLDAALRQGDLEGFFSLMDRMLKLVAGEKTVLPFSSLDLIFDNFVIDGSRWTMIDYEWAQSRVEVKHLLYRALRQYFMDAHLRGDHSDLYAQARSRYGITAEDEERYAGWEEDFQGRVGAGASGAPVTDAIPYRELEAVLPDSTAQRSLECFVDRGDGRGFTVEGRIPCESVAVGEDRRRVKIPLEGAKLVRFDPAETAGVLVLLSAYDEKGRALRPKKTNAARHKGFRYLFTTGDPQVIFRPGKGCRELIITYRFAPIPARAASALRDLG